MKSFGISVCVLALLGVSSAVMSGCRAMNAFSPQRQRQRRYAIDTDLDRMVDDADWILGLKRPSGLHNENMR
ncbi:MAG: hypothetical protein ACOCR1_04120 [Planctomycetota bacterium]